MESQEPDNDFERIFSLRRDEIGRTAMPVQSEDSQKKSPSSKKKDGTIAVFFDSSGNVVDSDDKNMSYGEIWNYDSEGRVTRIYVGDSWTTNDPDE